MYLPVMQFKPKIHKPAQEVVIHRWIKNGHETLITSYSWGFKLFSLAFFANCLTSSPILERPFLSASCIYYEYKIKFRTYDWNKGCLVWINPTNPTIQTKPIRLVWIFFLVQVGPEPNQLKSDVDWFGYRIQTFQIQTDPNQTNYIHYYYYYYFNA